MPAGNAKTLQPKPHRGAISQRARRLTAIALLTVVATPLSAQLTPVALRTEHLPNPAGIDVAVPRLSWEVTSTERGQRQTAWRILVADDPTKLAKDQGNLWDSGRVAGDETLNMNYGGRALSSGLAAWWKVRVWDRDGRESRWSEPARWSMGLLQTADWKAQWISFRDDSPLHTNRRALFLPPAHHYRKDFTATKTVRRATIHASALGLFELHLNGRRVSDSWFEPGWADYRQRAHYRTHDVTALVQTGANRVGAIVADGWYAGYVGYGLLVGYGPNKIGRNFYGKTPALLAQLEIEYTDGTHETIGTDASWQVTSDGPIREADLIMGESYDARLDEPAWAQPREATPSWRWAQAIRAEDNGSTRATFYDPSGPREVELGFQKPRRLQAYAAPPIRVTEELPARRLTEPRPGVYIFDLGQNIAGVVRLKVNAPAGTRLKLRFGEMLHPDGRLMTENLRRARATDEYICRGGGIEIWTPRFTYHGFQYVEISGLPSRPPLEAITGLALHNDTPITGEFACSDEVMTKFWRNTLWTQRANFIEMPTDCPQRDERLGWMGDAQVYARTATYHADVSAFFAKWIDDVREAQRDFGAYPDYAPYPMAHGAPGQTWGTAWTDAGVIVPWTMWKVYGDTRLLENHWASMTRFLEWRRQRAPDFRGKQDGNTWGDWLNVNEETPIEYVDVCYFAYSTARMAEMADALGKAEEAAGYRALWKKIRESWAREYLSAGGTLKVSTQTAHVLALWADLAGPQSARLASALAERIERNDFRMATGFLGTKPLLGVLTDHGQHDLAARLYQSRRFPSWGYEVVNGATTVWERWDSFTKEHGFDGDSGKNNDAMNSFSHYSFGAVNEWAFRQLAGIDTDGAGYQRIVIRPQPPGPGSNPEQTPIHWVRARYDSPRGRIVSAWRRSGERFELEVEIPANTTALIEMPATPKSIRESGRQLERVAGVRTLGIEDGRVRLELGSGRYHFATQWPTPASTPHR